MRYKKQENATTKTVDSYLRTNKLIRLQTCVNIINSTAYVKSDLENGYAVIPDKHQSFHGVIKYRCAGLLRSLTLYVVLNSPRAHSRSVSVLCAVQALLCVSYTALCAVDTTLDKTTQRCTQHYSVVYVLRDQNVLTIDGCPRLLIRYPTERLKYNTKFPQVHMYGPGIYRAK
jgi:hypothetical protein